MGLNYLNHELTLQNIMDSNFELEYIIAERNIVPLMIDRICNELTENKFDASIYTNKILIRKTSVNYLERTGYNFFQQSESKVKFKYFDRPVTKKVGSDANATLKVLIVTCLVYEFDVLPYHLTSVFRDSSITPDSSTLDGDNSSNSDSFEAETVVEMEFGNPYTSNFHYSEKLLIRLQNIQISGRLSQSTEVTPDTQGNETSGTKLPPVDFSMVWSRKYCQSQSHLALKLDHPIHYEQEYNRIRKSPLKVFHCLMNRQTHGPLHQRKVLEVIARPYYNIYPPADKEDVRRFNEYLKTEDELVNLESYVLLRLELCRSFDSYPSFA